MATIAEMKRRFERFYGEGGANVRKTISDKVKDTSDVILDLNRDQLLYGRDADGNILTPSYLNDPYFKTPKQAAYYQRMKSNLLAYHKNRMVYTNIQLFPEKDDGTPNLLINGKLFFNHFFIQVSSDSYSIGSKGSAASSIEDKYGKIYGLAYPSRQYYYMGWLRPAIWLSLINNLNKK